MKLNLTSVSIFVFMLTIFSFASADDSIGAKAAENSIKPTIEHMLIYAIQDEYLARTEYAYIIKTFETGRPFTNIIRSEKMHIKMLKPLFEKYGYDIPLDTSADHIPFPVTLRSAFETGVQAEIDNIAMYEKFLKMEIPTDIKDTFVRLKNASQNHLRAFKNGLSKFN